MPNQCVLCGIWDYAITDLFLNGCKLKKVTKDNCLLWKYILLHELEVGHLICRKHFGDNEQPLPGGNTTTTTSPTTRKRGRPSTRNGARCDTLDLTDREMELVELIVQLNNKLSQQQHQQNKWKSKYKAATNKHNKVVCRDKYDLLKEHYLACSMLPKMFDIAKYKDNPASLRRLTSAPSWEAFIEVVETVKPYYDSLFSSVVGEDRRDINPCNAVAITFMKGRLDLADAVCGDLFLVTERWANIIINAVLLGFVTEYKGKTIKLLPPEELQQHQVPKVDDETWYKRVGAIDKTYLYLQHSSSFDLQTDSFSNHHYTNEAQWITFVAPDGYLMLLEGPYLIEADDYNFQALIDDAPAGFGVGKWLESLQPYIAKPILEVDRGFRKAPKQVPSFVELRRPAYLSGREAFSAQEAIESEISCSNRVPVEQVNSRLNIQRIIRNRYPLKAIPKCSYWMDFAGIIHNMWYQPFYANRETYSEEELTLYFTEEGDQQIAAILSNM